MSIWTLLKRKSKKFKSNFCQNFFWSFKTSKKYVLIPLFSDRPIDRQTDTQKLSFHYLYNICLFPRFILFFLHFFFGIICFFTLPCGFKVWHTFKYFLFGVESRNNKEEKIDFRKKVFFPSENKQLFLLANFFLNFQFFEITIYFLFHKFFCAPFARISGRTKISIQFDELLRPFWVEYMNSEPPQRGYSVLS